MLSRKHVAGALIALLPFAACGQEIEFDVSSFEKRPFEWSGYLEVRPEYQRLDVGSSVYKLQFPGYQSDSLTRTSSAAELSGVYRVSDFRLAATGHASYVDDSRGWDRSFSLYEGYAAWQPTPRSSMELGKRTLRWGKAYAFSPVAFFERAKDPTDPELSREGFVMATGSWVRSNAGPFTTFSLTPIILPVTGDLNEDYGSADHANAGIKAYGLLHDTDVDLMYAAPGSQGGARWGADFSRNLGTNVEIHGEWAHFSDVPRVSLVSPGAITTTRASYSSYAVGLRYLTGSETTVILEYYRNGGGYDPDEMDRFWSAARASADSPVLRQVAARAAASGYVSPNPMRRYVYLRASQPEPFDLLYLTVALTAIVNADDGSYTVIPEVTYTRVTNVELRFRLQFNRGDPLTDYGEKAVNSRAELRMRYFF